MRTAELTYEEYARDYCFRAPGGSPPERKASIRWCYWKNARESYVSIYGSAASITFKVKGGAGTPTIDVTAAPITTGVPLGGTMGIRTTVERVEHFRTQLLSLLTTNVCEPSPKGWHEHAAGVTISNPPSVASLTFPGISEAMHVSFLQNGTPTWGRLGTVVSIFPANDFSGLNHVLLLCEATTFVLDMVERVSQDR